MGAASCAAISNDLLESELLGVENGTATAVEARTGHREKASAGHGTLFLNATGELSWDQQAKLLRSHNWPGGFSEPRAALKSLNFGFPGKLTHVALELLHANPLVAGQAAPTP